MKLNKSFHIYGPFRPENRVSFVLVPVFCLISVVTYAQGETSPDFMRSTGKIYVVVAVCLIVLLSIFGYLIKLDRKISRLEKKQKHE